MNNKYLIPANSKRSMYIFGLFEPIDLIILGVGLLLAVILVLIFYDKDSTVSQISGMMSPFIFTVIMCLPIPIHRNIWQFTVHVYTYFTNRRSYIWKGWCVLDGEDSGK